MIKINTEKCIGCGKCAGDCFPRDIEIKDKKAYPRNKLCIECGHCVAICPVDAVTLIGYNTDDILDCKNLDKDINADVYLNQLKARRSIRNFTDEPVTEEEIKMILEAGRFSPTGGNRQNVSYYISRNNVAEFRDLLMNELYEMGKKVIAAGVGETMYAQYWIDMYEDYKKCGADRLFFDAGTVIVISSDSPQAAIIAAAHMETMIYSMGLGMLYSGFTSRAVSYSEKLQDYLQLKEGYKVHAVLVVGHSNVQYERTVPRKPADVIWN